MNTQTLIVLGLAWVAGFIAGAVGVTIDAAITALNYTEDNPVFVNWKWSILWSPGFWIGLAAIALMVILWMVAAVRGVWPVAAIVWSLALLVGAFWWWHQARAMNIYIFAD